MSNAFAEHRFRRLVLDPRFVIDMFNWQVKGCHAYSLPVTVDIPEGTEVVSFHANDWNRTIEICVCHESFEPVPPGEIIPLLGDPYESLELWRGEIDRTQRERVVNQVVKAIQNMRVDRQLNLVKAINCLNEQQIADTLLIQMEQDDARTDESPS